MSARDDTEVERLEEEARWHWDRAERAEAERDEARAALARVRSLYCGHSPSNPHAYCISPPALLAALDGDQP